MPYSLDLLNFIELVTLEELHICFLCWRTSKERSFVDDSDLNVFLDLIENKSIKSSVQNYSICYYCNCQLKRSIQLLRNLMTTNMLMTLIRSLKKTDQKMVLKSIDLYFNGERDVPNPMSLQHWRYNTALTLNKKIPTMKMFSDLTSMEPIVLDNSHMESGEVIIPNLKSSVEDYKEMAKSNVNMQVVEEQNDIVIIENSITSDKTGESKASEPIYIIDDVSESVPPPPVMSVMPVMPAAVNTPILVVQPLPIANGIILCNSVKSVEEDNKVLVAQSPEQLVVHPILIENIIHGIPTLDCKIFDNVLIPFTEPERLIFKNKYNTTLNFVINDIDIDLIKKELNSKGTPMFQISFHVLTKFLPNGCLNFKNNLLIINKKKPNVPVVMEANPMTVSILPLNNDSSKQVDNPFYQIRISDVTHVEKEEPVRNKDDRSKEKVKGPLSTAPQPILSSNVDWEAKIPMDVISYANAVDPCPDKSFVNLNPPNTEPIEQRQTVTTTKCIVFSDEEDEDNGQVSPIDPLEMNETENVGQDGLLYGLLTERRTVTLQKTKPNTTSHSFIQID